MPVRSSNGRSRPDIDVLILGTGIAGTMLATVLARNGAKVQLVDNGSHPRFAIGESTIPHTATLFRLIAERYDVPELRWMSTFDSARANIATTFGIKRGFNFLYHRRGQPQEPTESHQLPIPRIMHVENHFFRQDLDAWLLNLAVLYGARVRQLTNIADVSFDDAGVTVTADSGESWRARYLIDASGFRSPLAAKLSLRETPCRFRHHSRTLFTHMVGVPPWEKIARNLGPVPASESTLHHVFDGGWIWVIPFNNHARSTNPLVSVGLSVDPRRFPKPDCSPEDEFRSFIADYPDIARHFASARAVRPWVSTGRLQYSSHQTIGPRWCLAMHAAGFLDALFSRGLSFTMDFVHAICWRLLDALREDDFSVERFSHVEHLQQGLLDYNDDLVANAYGAFRSFELWETWVRVWALGEILALFQTNRAYGEFRATHDRRILDRLEDVAPFGSLPNVPEVREFFRYAYDEVAKAGSSELGAAAAAARLLERMQAVTFSPPAFGITDPANRYFLAEATKIRATLRWANSTAPPEVGRNFIEGLSQYWRIRFSRREFDILEETKYALAKRPLIGRSLRPPAPR